MKIRNIKLMNFAKYDQVDVSFDDNVTYLVGKNGSGKSTLGITAIWYMFQGIAEKASDGKIPLIGERFRFIGPKGASARGEMTLYDEKTMAEIKVTRKLTKAGTDLSFEGPEGLELNQQWLTDLFNVFMISPKMFCQLSAKEQAKALGIDTKEFDEAIANLKKEYTGINAVIRSFGELSEVEKVEKVDVDALHTERAKIADGLNKLYLENKATNKLTRKAWEDEKDRITKEVEEFNADIDEKGKDLAEAKGLSLRLTSLLSEFPRFSGMVDAFQLTGFIDNFPKLGEKKVASKLWPVEPTNLSDKPDEYIPEENEKVYIREIPSNAALREIDQRILEAGKVNEDYLLYTQYLQKKEAKEAKKKELDENVSAQKDKEQARIEYVKAFKFPFSNISVGEDGELLVAGKPIKEPYFSTGEILKVVPILISTRNPELKYVFLQDFNLMDDEKQADVETYLTNKGFQLVVEMVGKEKIVEKNCILLRDNLVVEDYAEVAQPSLNL